jgi:hypothetical protein
MKPKENGGESSTEQVDGRAAATFMYNKKKCMSCASIRANNQKGIGRVQQQKSQVPITKNKKNFNLKRKKVRYTSRAWRRSSLE